MFYTVGRYKTKKAFSVRSGTEKRARKDKSHNRHFNGPDGPCGPNGQQALTQKKSSVRSIKSIEKRFHLKKATELPTGFPGIFKGQSPLNGRATHPTATRFFLPSFFFFRKKSYAVMVKEL